MKQLIPILQEIQVSNFSYRKIKNFAEKRFGGSGPWGNDKNDGDGDFPDFGGWENINDAGYREFPLKDFLYHYKHSLTEIEIAILWVYTFININGGDIDEDSKEEMEDQLHQMGFNYEDIFDKSLKVYNS